MDNELKHYGVKGMKWGVRRYQNYDGTYTQEGMKRYNKSMENYEQKRSAEKQTKADYKAGKASKSDVQKATSERKKYERQLKSDYKQLANDKAADKGKKLYQQGKTIREANSRRGLERTVAFGGSLAASSLAKAGKMKAASSVAAASAGLLISSRILELKDMHDAKLLRAYYAHSRNKDTIKNESANAEWASKTKEELLKAQGWDTVSTMSRKRRRK